MRVLSYLLACLRGLITKVSEQDGGGSVTDLNADRIGIEFLSDELSKPSHSFVGTLITHAMEQDDRVIDFHSSYYSDEEHSPAEDS